MITGHYAAVGRRLRWSKRRSNTCSGSVRDDLTGIRFKPTPVKLPSAHTKLDNEVPREVLRLD